MYITVLVEESTYVHNPRDVEKLHCIPEFDGFFGTFPTGFMNCIDLFAATAERYAFARSKLFLLKIFSSLTTDGIFGHECFGVSVSWLLVCSRREVKHMLGIPSKVNKSLSLPIHSDVRIGEMEREAIGRA